MKTIQHIQDTMPEQITIEQYILAQDNVHSNAQFRGELPGFKEIKERLRMKGLPFNWVDKVVHPDEPGAVFVEKGIPFERSNCPNYEGIWLCGGFSSVKCRAHNDLLPGMMWDTTCGKKPEQCPLRKKNIESEA